MPRWTAAVLLAALPTGCCTLLPCAGGFAWRATPASGIVEPGVYTFRVTLDDSETFELACEIDQDGAMNPDACDRWIESDTSNFEVLLDPAGLPTSSAPIEGFSIGAKAETRAGVVGPERVAIEMTLDGAPLVAVDYELEYERERINGELCDFCDEAEPREHTW